ncbi:MAG: Ig-like domain-containing protein, partial [Limnohabitans sp.]
VGADGKYSITPSTPLTSGAHSVTTTATDPSGNESAKSDPLAFTVTGAAPAAPAISSVADNLAPNTGALQKGDTTNDATLVVSGTGTAGTVVHVYEGSKDVGSATVDSKGLWTLETSSLGADGTKNLTAKAIDSVGQVSPTTGIFNVVLDTTAPAAPATSAASDDVGAVKGPIASGSTTDDAQPTFSGTGTPGDIIKIYDGANVIGSTTVGTDGKYSVTPSTPLADGPHSIATTATDPSGNESAKSAPLDFKSDTTAVSLTITKALDDVGAITADVANNGSTDDAKPTLVGTATANAVVTISEGTTILGTTTASSTGAWSFTPTVAQANGAHTYTATAVNAAGTNASATFTLTVDTAVPAAPSTAATVTDDVGSIQGPIANNGTTDDTQPTFSG